MFNTSISISNKKHSRTALIFSFHLKKTAAESYRLVRQAYGEYDLWQDTCERWFRRFKNGDFKVADKKHGKPSKIFEDVQLQALFDENDLQTQKQLAKQLDVSQQAVFDRLHEMGKIWKTVDGYQQNTCDILFARYKKKSFCIV